MHVAALLAVATVGAAGCESGRGDVAGALIREQAERMADAGIDCADLVVEEPDASGSGGPTIGLERKATEASKVGYCHLPGAPKVQGVPLSTAILVFEDREHLESLPDPHFLPGQALVYGDTWEIYVVPAESGQAVKAAVGGTLVEGIGDFPLDESATPLPIDKTGVRHRSD